MQAFTRGWLARRQYWAMKELQRQEQAEWRMQRLKDLQSQTGTTAEGLVEVTEVQLLEQDFAQATKVLEQACNNTDAKYAMITELEERVFQTNIKADRERLRQEIFELEVDMSRLRNEQLMAEEEYSNILARLEEAKFRVAQRQQQLNIKVRKNEKYKEGERRRAGRTKIGKVLLRRVPMLRGTRNHQLGEKGKKKKLKGLILVIASFFPCVLVLVSSLLCSPSSSLFFISSTVQFFFPCVLSLIRCS